MQVGCLRVVKLAENTPATAAKVENAALVCQRCLTLLQRVSNVLSGKLAACDKSLDIVIAGYQFDDADRGDNNALAPVAPPTALFCHRELKLNFFRTLRTNPSIPWSKVPCRRLIGRS